MSGRNQRASKTVLLCLAFTAGTIVGGATRPDDWPRVIWLAAASIILLASAKHLKPSRRIFQHVDILKPQRARAGGSIKFMHR